MSRLLLAALVLLFLLSHAALHGSGDARPPEKTDDFGDAPDPSYPTLLANNGARHTLNSNVYMGSRIDIEIDGQPDPNAEGDDNNLLSDEDGVVLPIALSPGQPDTLEVTVSTDGHLNVWFDWDRSGSWDAGESIYSDWVSSGVNSIPFVVPSGASVGKTFARFRFNTFGPLPVDGPAFDGEVEDYAVFVEADFGDAPDDLGYPTLLANNGARHLIVSNVFMGMAIDGEGDGQPDPIAEGDDSETFPDDEDGVAFATPLVPGLMTEMHVWVSVEGWLDAWFDWDESGSWDVGETVYSDPVLAGPNSITFVPAGPDLALIFARFRYNTVGPLPVDGLASDGEVEDYAVLVETPLLDFGDAPDPGYPTSAASNGAWHKIDGDVYMGNWIDPEPDGQPHPNALGDDQDGTADEDGVVFVTSLVFNQWAQVDVAVSETGYLDAWFDLNQDGYWDWDERLVSELIYLGVNQVSFFVPWGTPGPTFARFRFNTVGPLPPYGGAFDGEVEDYEVVVEEPPPLMDFGDAPDPSYPTLLASDGARHEIVSGVFMGASIDSELDGQPDPIALGDDTGGVDDEDGVVFGAPLYAGLADTVDVIVSVDGWLNVWIDWDSSGSWEAGESVYSAAVVAGANSIPFVVPAVASLGQTFARFRYNTGGPLTVDGLAPDGEVEDYKVFIDAAPQLDFGDAPDPGFPTLFASNGARHTIVQGVFMGALIDAEGDGQPHPNAQGDDLAGLADEDGVVFATPLVINQNAQVDVTVSVAGWLDFWFDWNLSGAWDAFELTYSGPVAAGVNPITFNVPAAAVHGQTFARFRYSTGGALPIDGAAPDGEVEDYTVTVEDDVTDVGDQVVPDFFELHDAIPNPFNPQTTLSFSLPSASHVRLTIFDVRGRMVTTLLDEERGPGHHQVVWDGLDARRRPVASGVYLYRLEAGSFVETKRMVLLK